LESTIAMLTHEDRFADQPKFSCLTTQLKVAVVPAHRPIRCHHTAFFDTQHIVEFAFLS
jgi:hypothetical protein